MPLRFRKSKSLLPGVRVNVGLKGASVSLGGKRARMTVGKRGTSVGTSLPGTGVSYTTKPKRGCPLTMFLLLLPFAGLAVAAAALT
jgi:hypothetical protein